MTTTNFGYNGNGTYGGRARQTVRELAPAIGAKVRVAFENIAIDCTVVDAKNSWGQVRLQIQPLAGVGRQWIEMGRLITQDGGGYTLEVR